MQEKKPVRWVKSLWGVPLVLALGCAQAAEEQPCERTSCGGAVLTPAQLEGTAPADPPRESLEGESLIIYVDDTISGAVLTVSFTSAAADAAAILGEINAVTTGRVTASLTDDHITLTTVEAGKDVFLSVYNTDGARILGLAELPLMRGSATEAPEY